MMAHLVIKHARKCYVSQNRNMGQKSGHAGTEPGSNYVVYNYLDPCLIAIQVIDKRQHASRSLSPGSCYAVIFKVSEVRKLRASWFRAKQIL